MQGMIRNEGELAQNIQTLRDCSDKGSWSAEGNNPCEKAYQEVMNFMKQEGPLQEQLKSRDLLKIEGNSLTFSNTIYPSEKSKN